MMRREYLATMKETTAAVTANNDGTTLTNELQVLQQYAFKVSLEADQKCVKPSITVYSNDLDTAIDTAVQGFVKTRKKLTDVNIVTAPLGEVEKK